MNPNSPDVTELMERIRQEARAHPWPNAHAPRETPGLELPLVADPLPAEVPPPRLASASQAAAEPPVRAVLADMAARARHKITVGGWLPRWLRPLARNQGGYNGILLEAVERLGEANQQLQEQIEVLRADLQAQTAWQSAWQGAWLKSLAQARESEREWMRAIEPYLLRGLAESEAHRRRAEQGESRLAQLDDQNHHTRNELDQLGVRAGYHEAHASSLDERLSHLQSQADEQAGRLHGTSAHADRLGEHVGNLQRQADSQDAHITEVHAHLDRSGEHLNQLSENLSALHKQVAAQDAHITEVHTHLDLSGQHLNQLGGQLGALQSQVAAQDAQISRLADHVGNLQKHADGQNQHNQGADRHLGSLQSHADDQNRHNEGVDARLRDLQRHADGQNEHNQRVDQHLGNLQIQTDHQGADIRRAEAQQALWQAATRQLDERQVADASYLKNQSGLLGRLVQRLLDPAENGAAGQAAAPDSPARPGDAAGEYHRHELDAFYLAFENRFRGSREAIMERARVHLRTLEDARVGGAESPVLDLGCGRGEWLEVLRERGFSAAGVDLNASMIEECRERGLEVTSADVLGFLRDLPDACRGGITAFHLIEHLPFRELVDFVRECHRVLQPGGVVIFETPNPENIVVGASEFWGDFTHQRPVPAESASFLVEQAGFVDVRIQPLHPVPEEPGDNSGPHSAVWERVHGLLYGPRDYAVVGTKACTS
jgi:SAM-dependent methyltransferase